MAPTIKLANFQECNPSQVSEFNSSLDHRGIEGLIPYISVSVDIRVLGHVIIAGNHFLKLSSGTIAVKLNGRRHIIFPNNLDEISRLVPFLY